MDLRVPVSARDHVRGAPHARVTLVEYGDFDCRFSRESYPVVRQLLERFEGDLRFVFRHNPRGELHPHAHLAAQSSEAAARQGRFWEMHDRLFEQPRGHEEQALISYAREIELEREPFLAALHSAEVAARVRGDEVGGLHSGVIGTPSFFVEGAHFRGKPDLGGLAAAIEVELAKHPAPATPEAEAEPPPANGARRTKRRIPRFDRPGHLNPEYEALLLREGGYSGGRDDTPAFLSSRSRTGEPLAEALGEEFVDSATHGHNEEDEVFEQLVPEEEGGPFVETPSKTQFANDAEAPNVPGATREPFPKT